MDYRVVINRFASNCIQKKVDIPDYHLMVGSAECLHPLPLVVFPDYMPKNMAKPIIDNSKLSYEEIQQNLSSGKLSINDFYENIYPMGDAIIK